MNGRTIIGRVPAGLLLLLGLALSGWRGGEAERRAPTPPDPMTGLSARLRGHIEKLASAGGTGSRVVFTEGNRRSVAYVLDQMRRDEIEHGQAARDAGGVTLPVPVQRVMRAAAKVMTTTAYYI